MILILLFSTECNVWVLSPLVGRTKLQLSSGISCCTQDLSRLSVREAQALGIYLHQLSREDNNHCPQKSRQILQLLVFGGLGVPFRVE